MSRRGWALLFCVTPRVCLAGRRVRFRSLLREMETHMRYGKEDMSVPKDFKSEILDILKLEHPNQTAKVDSIIQTMVHDLGSEVFSWDKTRLSKHINKILSPSTSRNGRRHKNAQHTGADFSANKTYPRLYPGDRNKCLL